MGGFVQGATSRAAAQAWLTLLTPVSSIPLRDLGNRVAHPPSASPSFSTCHADFAPDILERSNYVPPHDRCPVLWQPGSTSSQARVSSCLVSAIWKFWCWSSSA